MTMRYYCNDRTCGGSDCKTCFPANKDTIEREYVASDILILGKSGDMLLNEIEALAKGGFAVTLCDDSENWNGEGSTPLIAIENALQLIP